MTTRLAYSWRKTWFTGRKLLKDSTEMKVCKTFIHRFDSDPRLQLTR
jgi:hypothetical protein